MDSATGSPHNKVKEERYDPAVNFDADTDATDDVLNNQCSSTLKTSDGEELSSGEDEEKVEWIYNDLSCSPHGGPQDCMAQGYCEGGVLLSNYSAKNPHISSLTKMYSADVNRWLCRNAHPNLCKPCYHSKTCPVDGIDFGRM